MSEEKEFEETMYVILGEFAEQYRASRDGRKDADDIAATFMMLAVPEFPERMKYVGHYVKLTI